MKTKMLHNMFFYYIFPKVITAVAFLVKIIS
jgi:hypothetical protein